MLLCVPQVRSLRCLKAAYEAAAAVDICMRHDLDTNEHDGVGTILGARS